jgi:hypothetical protein
MHCIRWFKRTTPAALAFIFFLYPAPCLWAKAALPAPDFPAVGAQLGQAGSKPVAVKPSVLNSVIISFLGPSRMPILPLR